MNAEHGCGDPVSLTPPASVVAAAQLACRVTIDELTRDCAMPATSLYVLEPREAHLTGRLETAGDAPPG